MKPGPGVCIGGELELLRLLGDGAMSSVWLAERRGSDERVAVKLMAHALSRDSTERARFEREARLAGRLESPHVARCLDHGLTDDGVPYLVMELLEGETLAERLDTVGVLRAPFVLAVLEQVATALDEAHALGIVHRDIKPANIFLVDEGDELLVKVLDFGMAKRVGAADPSVVTEAGTAVGTPDYMSPEQLRDAKNVDYRADLWALGVVAYRCLSGHRPFTSGTFAGLCMAICQGRYRPATELDPSLPTALDAWLVRALSIDPVDRHDSATEAVAALREALLPPRLSTDPPARAPGAASHKQRALWWALLLLAAAALGAWLALRPVW